MLNGGLAAASYVSVVLHRMRFGKRWLANYDVDVHQWSGDRIAARFGLYAFTTNSGRPLASLEEGWNAYQSALAKHPDAPRVLGVQAQICVAPTDEEAAAQAEHFLYQTRQATALRSGHEQVVSGVSAPLPFEGEAGLDEVFAQRTLSGTPDTVARKLEAYTAIADIDQLNCVFQVGSMAPKLVRQSMKMFAYEVAPSFASCW